MWQLVFILIIRTVLLICKPFVSGHGAHQEVRLLLCLIFAAHVDIFAIYRFSVAIYKLTLAPYRICKKSVNSYHA